MRKRLLLAGTLGVLLFFLVYYFPKSFSGPVESEETGMHLAMAHEHEITKDPATGKIPRERLFDAVAARDARMNSGRTNGAVQGINWQERGPNNVGGRTRAVIFDLNDAANGYKKIWAGGVGGGLWFTNDITAATPVWNKVNDLMDNLAISAIAQDPSNPQIMYVGTGEGWFNADAVRGLGLWKSTDGGNNWNRLFSTSNFYYVNDLAIDNNGHLYAAVRPYTTGDPAGIQKSTDGGLSWTQVAGQTGFSSNRGADIEVATNGDIYVSLGTTGSTGGIYLSEFSVHGANTGNVNTWVNVTPNAAGVVTTPSGWQRIELATAPSNANVVYALFQGASTSNCTSIQKYNRTSNSWEVKVVPTIVDQGNNSNFTRSQAWYDLAATVDPNNENVVYIGGVDALRTDNGGNGWVQMSTWSLANAPAFTSAQSVHADHHVVTYAPGSSTRAVWGTDGGIYYSETSNSLVPTKPVFANKNRGYNVTQYYACAIHPTNANYFLAGAQDNGTQKFTAAGLNNTTNATGGDGGYCHIDQDNPQIQITSYVYNNYYLSTNGGASFVGRFFGNSGSFINPTDYDNAANKLYGGSTAGNYFRWDNPATSGTTTVVVSVNEFNGGSVRHVAVSPTVANRVYFGLSNGDVVMVNNADAGNVAMGKVLRNGSGSVSCIAIDPANENHMLVTYSNYGITSVYESFNATATTPSWTAVEGNLPDMPVRWAMFDPRNSDWALLATELGVWSTDNLSGSSTDWQPTNGGLANVRVDMLQYRASDRTIAAATHGRGLFTTVVPLSTGGSQINFSAAVSTTAEEAAGVTGCRRYKDYQVAVAPSTAPAGDATVTYSVVSGTATMGADYHITTNGDFTSPSQIHTFPSGSTSSQSLTVRIYDDGKVESAEDIEINLVVSGSTNAQTGFVNAHTITITDNDLPPASSVVAASALGASGTEFLTTSSEEYFYSATGEVLAKLKNLSTHQYGCTQVAVTRAGTGSSQFWNYDPASYLMDKVFDITPASNSASGVNQVTLYFTAAEKAGWEAATGKSWNDIMIVKVPSSIANVTPLNTQPDGPGTVQVETPVRDSFANGYTLSFTFNNGFSSFGAGIPGRMHTQLNLTAAILGTDIRLDWTTSTETGSTVFEVEKSYDGLSYRKIGSVQAGGNKLTPTSYQFTDKENVQVNHYRIRMKHSDGYVLLSNVVFINKTDAPQQMYVLTNPFRHQVQLRFGRMIEGKAIASLYDAAGKLVHQSVHPGPSLTTITIGTERVISRGMYILEVVADGKRYTTKLRKD